MTNLSKKRRRVKSKKVAFRFTRVSQYVFLQVLGIIFSFHIEALDTSSYRLEDSWKSTSEKSQTEQIVNLWVDKRIPKDIQNQDSSEDSKYLNAVVVLTNDLGESLSQIVLERPRAWFEEEFKANKIPGIVGITVDYSVSFGSYNEPITGLIQIDSSGMKWVNAIDRDTKVSRELFLMKSLKTDWQMSKKEPNTILEIACRPMFGNEEKNDDLEFEVIYTKYTYNGKNWIKSFRSRKGFWEADGKFDENNQLFKE